MATSSSIVGAIADFVVAEVEAQEAPIEAAIQTGETDVVAVATKLLSEIPAVKGVFAVLEAPVVAAITAAIEAGLAKAEAQYGPSVIFALLVSVLKSEATKLGG